MKHSITIYLTALAALVACVMTSCIEDSFATSPSDQPTFSTDTLRMGENYTLEGSPTCRFTVYNRHGKMLNISSISLRDDNDGYFRLNVDGFSGKSFSDIEIRPNDSIFVFVEATLPENGKDEILDIRRHLDFVTNGVTSTVVLDIQSQDAIRLDGATINTATTWKPGKPYLISDTVRIAEGVSLTLEAGTRVRMKDKSAFKVEGTLIAEGTPEEPVEITGYRTGNVASSIPYELMSGQWGGIYFASTSTGNSLTGATIRNSSDGLTLSSCASGDAPALTLTNCQIRNTTNYIIDACHSNIKAVGCEFTDASQGILHLTGGSHVFNHCTIANYYLFTVLGGPAIQFAHINADDADDANPSLLYLSAEFTNSIIYGNGTEFSHGDLTGTSVSVRRCILKSDGSDDDNFIDCLWNSDPMYYTVRNEYLFDYRIKPESPAIGAADPACDIYGFTADRYGVTVHSPADLGAYTFVEPEE